MVENESITRPILAEFKKRVDTSMSKDEIEKLLSENEEWLRLMISQETEVVDIQDKMNKLLRDVEDLSKSNVELKEELITMIDNYDLKLA